MCFLFAQYWPHPKTPLPPHPPSRFWCLWCERHKASRSHPRVPICCLWSATWLMYPLYRGCPQNVARTQRSLKRHMIDVSTVLRLSTECGQDTIKLKHLENVCVWSDVFVWTVASLCFCSASVLFCFCSVLFCFSFRSVSLLWMSRVLSRLPRPAPQAPSTLTATVPSAVPPLSVFSLFRTCQYGFKTQLHFCLLFL